MGKGAIVLVLVSLYGWTMSHSNKSRADLARQDQQALYQERVLAREQAHTGFDLVATNAANDFENYRENLTTNAYRDGSFSVSAIGVSGDKVTVSATGSVGRANYTIVGDLETESITPLSALNVVGPVDVTVGNGNSFLVTGYDTNPGGDIGSGDAEDTYGVSTTSEAATDAFQDGLDDDQVTGKNGEDSFDSLFDPSFLTDLDSGIAAYCVAHPDQCEMYDGNQRFTGNERFGSTEDPVIVMVDGDVELRGNVKGYGILRVKGELSTAAGNPMWEGAVYATTNGGTHSLRGNPKFYGAIVLETGEDETMNFAVNGNVVIAYSSEALEALPVLPALIANSSVTEVQLKNIRQASDAATTFSTLTNLQVPVQ